MEKNRRTKHFLKDNKAMLVFHLENDVLHNKNNPTFIQYSLKYNLWFRSYFKNGKRHRIDGPAIEVFDPKGRLVGVEYWENGELKA